MTTDNASRRDKTITFRGESLTLSGAQLLEALDFMAPDRDRDQLESELTFRRGEGHAGNGMYCWLTEYQEEGAFFVDGSTAVPADVAPPAANEPAAIPIGYALVPIHRSYDMRTKALIAFNTTEQARRDRDDALDAVHRATIDAAPQPPAQASAREELTLDQQRTVECADAWLSDKGLPTYTELRTLLTAYLGQPKPPA
ncbi:hypothetical protein [Burkholderia sp. AW49-1]